MQVELQGVLKVFRSMRALDNVSMTIEPGQIIAVIGSNGAGKTTLLRCLAGMAAIDQGRILMDGREFRRDQLDLRRRIFILPDFPFLFWQQSVIRNLAIILRLYDTDDAGMEQRVLQLLRVFDLLPLALRPVYSLSRGQLYKLGLVAMVAADCDLWLLDEPFASGMDPQGIEIFRSEARAAAQRGRTILYTTQILEIAERFCDRVCVIEKSELRAFDTLANLRGQSRDKDHVLEDVFRRLRGERA